MFTRRSRAIGALAVASLILMAPSQANAAETAITPRFVKSVSLDFTNDSNRVITMELREARPGDKGRKVAVFPGETYNVVGDRGVWQIDLRISWCPGQGGSSCAVPLTATIKAQNAIFGYPSIRIDKDDHGFKALERYTFEHAYGTAASRGVAKFKSQRLVDSDMKRFTMTFTYAAPLTR
jgi:hypothetical protein